MMGVPFGSPLSSPLLESPLSSAAAPRNGWTIFGAEKHESGDTIRPGIAQDASLQPQVSTLGGFQFFFC